MAKLRFFLIPMHDITVVRPLKEHDRVDTMRSRGVVPSLFLAAAEARSQKIAAVAAVIVNLL